MQLFWFKYNINYPILAQILGPLALLYIPYNNKVKKKTGYTYSVVSLKCGMQRDKIVKTNQSYIELEKKNCNLNLNLTNVLIFKNIH